MSILCALIGHRWGDLLPAESIRLLSTCGGSRYAGDEHCQRCSCTREVRFTLPDRR